MIEAASSPSASTGIHPHDLAELLGREGVCVRASHHCAQPLMAKLGVPATARASFAAYNVPEDVDALVAAVRSAQRVFAVMDDLYRDFILEHYKRPRNFGELDPHDLEAHEYNPLCGDEIGVQIRVADGEDRRPALQRPRLRDLAGRSVDRLRGADRDGSRRRPRRSKPTGCSSCSESTISATRRKCALLLLKALRQAITGEGTWPADAAA